MSNLIRKIMNCTVVIFLLNFQAEERSSSRRRALARLRISVEAMDIHPPQMTVSSGQGFVEENSPVGTVVVDEEGRPIVFRVTDQDRVSEKSGPRCITRVVPVSQNLLWHMNMHTM